MKLSQTVYRKNFSLVVAFLILVSVTLIVALIVAYQLTAQNVENDFASKKNNVVDQTINPYKDFFSNKIPEITSYHGLLDSASAANYADSVFHAFAFVRRIVFYEIVISNQGHYRIRKKQFRNIC